ncbi:NADP-dependent 3-hydroxy acid dehydrogenase YdfG [Sulfitobacter pontiacus]|jgi:NADP-dependent 3-hydroxy acid dehydrogenase YdfG|uniref:NADP-dependent 3-hydroxy acid dehydrogenase YdfG n=1 Tax=Sulfitobacter pontiacus TaxID=60137 RepID=A0A1H2QV37_9RHOB|nr:MULTISPECIES: SDR family oxidoreductase [Sulfitobacter]QPO08180.1 SDR family oxidoreductase [Sulfitobacter sp. B30-2]SDW10740.1 NADP-dependent 3-hydroxy acid dehydrogenase YdfG [Sulfitobacter pontiacus]
MTKTLFITGASSGIGAATARAAAKAGWNVGLFARSEDKLKDLAREIGDQALVLAGDATQYDDQEQAMSRLAQKFGQIDAVFANAGRGTSPGGTEKGDPDDWKSMIDLNVTGALYTAHAAMPYLRKTTGQYVVTGSAAGRRHIKGSIYGATKFFIHGFAGNLADEMAEWGGRCMVVSPGMVDTAFFDEAKPDKLKPEDVASAVMHALEAPAHAAVREIHLMPVD